MMISVREHPLNNMSILMVNGLVIEKDTSRDESVTHNAFREILINSSQYDTTCKPVCHAYEKHNDEPCRSLRSFSGCIIDVLAM